MEILKNNPKYFLYRFANPITLKREDMIDYQLKEKGIDRKEIKYIIISHLHPDHIGGLKFFPNSNLILTETCYNNLKSGKDNLLIFNELFPDDFENRLILIKNYKENKLFPYKESFDLFSDSSMLMIEVDGHAKGQGCLFLPEKNLLIAADVCWGTEYLPLTDKMKWLARKIQNNFEDYKQGSDLLKKVMKNDISVIVSHDNKEKIKSFLPDMKKAIERFPLTVFCSVVVFILSVYLVENPELKNENLLNELHKMVILLGMSIPLTLALELAREKYLSGKNRWVIRSVNALITLVFIIFYRFYYLSGKNSSSTLDSLEQLMATGIIFFLCFLLVPVIGKKDEEEKYFQSVIVDKTVTILFSVVLFLGLIAVFATIDGLSLIKLDSNIYIETWLFVVFVFSVIFFLSKLKKVDESLENYEIHKIFKFLIYFIVIPLITTYTGILYVYFGKMLITRSWPQGLVSHLILWYTIFSLFIMIMVTPMAKKDSVARVFKKYFPFASLPLLVLSIVSISKRISQYGVTPSRYFVVLLAMWLIFCMVSSIFKARLSVILISLITVVYISVFTPVNNRRITLMSQNKRFEKILVKHGLLKDGKLVKKPELAKEKKYEVTDVLNYILGINDRRNDIENLKPFGKTDGKPYKDREEFEKSLGIDSTWYQYSDFVSIGDSYFVTFGINENVLTNMYNGIEEVKGYDYAITNLESYFTDNNNVKEFFGKYPVKLSQEGIAVYDGKIEDNKELIKVNMPEIVDKIIKNPEIQQRTNKRKDEIKDSVVPENILEFTGENEKVKYKVKVIEISVTGEEHKVPRVSKYYYSFYYSVKK